MTRTLELGRSGGWLALTAISAGYFLVILDATVVAIATDRMAIGLHTTVTGLEWVVDGYTVTLAALLLLGGGLADRFGARRSFRAGLVLFGVASIGCAAAPVVGVLVVARVVQGAGAALLIPASLALVRHTYPDPAERARAIGIWGAVGSVAATCGPVVGGLLAQSLGWPAIFAINVPFCVMTWVLIRRTVPAISGSGQPIPVAGHLATVAAMSGATALAILGGARPLAVPSLVVAAIVAVGGVIAIGVAGRAGRPLVPAALRTDPRFRGGSLIGLAQNFGFYGQLFVVSLYLQRQLGYSPAVAGLALLPESVIGIAASALSGRFAARYGARPVMMCGLSLGALGLAGLACIGPRTPYPLLVLPLLLVGFGMAFTMPAATTITVSPAGPAQAGLAGAAFNASRQFGGALGVAVAGSLLTFDHGSVRLASACAALAFLAAVPIAARLRAVRDPEMKNAAPEAILARH